MKWLVIFLINLIYLWDEYHCLETTDLYANVTVNKKENTELKLQVSLLKEGNISVVVFSSDTFMRFAGVGTGKKMFLAPFNESKRSDTDPILTIDDTKKQLTVNAIKPIRNTEKNWKFVMMKDVDSNYCQENIHCQIINNASTAELDYEVTFQENNLEYYIKDMNVIVNNKTLKASRVSGAIPTDMTFTYYYRYDRPTDFRIECKFLGDDGGGQWSDLRISKSKKILQRNATLFDEKAQFNCTYELNNKKEKMKIIKTANIIFEYVRVSELLSVKINGQSMENHTSVEDSGGQVVQYDYRENQTINFICSPKNMETCAKYNCSVMLYLPESNQGFITAFPTEGNKPLEKIIQLGKGHNGSLIACTYKDNVYGSINATIAVKLNLRREIKESDLIFKVNGVEKRNNDIYSYEEDGSITIECIFKEVPVTKQDSAMDLIISKDNKQVKNKLLEKKNNVIHLDTIMETFSLSDNQNYTCNAREQGQDKPSINISKSIIVKKLIKTTTERSVTRRPTQKDVMNNDNQLVSNETPPTDQKIFYIVVPCAGLAIFVIIICILKVARKKHRDTEQLVQAERENLHDSPPPNFPQNATLEETYCRPADTKYTEPTYAQPYVPQTVEELYSKPVPKSARSKPQNDCLYASLEFENAYAKVKSKNQRDKTVEPTYAEVGKDYNDEPTYASVNECANMPDNYANVFDNSSYVYSKQGAEYVEPSYCEVSKLKK